LEVSDHEQRIVLLWRGCKCIEHEYGDYRVGGSPPNKTLARKSSYLFSCIAGVPNNMSNVMVSLVEKWQSLTLGTGITGPSNPRHRKGGSLGLAVLVVSEE